MKRGYRVDIQAHRASRFLDLTSKKLCFFFLTMDEGLDHSSPIVFPDQTHGEATLAVMKKSTTKYFKAMTIPDVRLIGGTRDGPFGQYTWNQRRQIGELDKHMQLVVSPTCSVFSPLYPMPPVHNSLPHMMVNPSSKPEEWMYRTMTVEEVANAYSLTASMKEWASKVFEPEFVSVISATAPLNLMTHVFASIYLRMQEDISKAGGERGAVDTDVTEIKECFNGSVMDGIEVNDLISVGMDDDRSYHFGLNNNARMFEFKESELPAKGEVYVAIVFSGYASLLPEFKKAMPEVKMITFDTVRRFDPTVLGDYLEFDWKEFGDQYGYPKAAVFMPPCGARSRQHPIGKHYNVRHQPVSDEAVKADQCVAKAMHDIELLMEVVPNFQFAVENPMYKKFTGLPSIQPFISRNQFTVLQYADYDPDKYTLKRTIFIHNLKFWIPKKIEMKRNKPNVKWNSVGWNQERRWSWPQPLSKDIAESIAKALSFHSTNAGSLVFALCPRECVRRASIATMAPVVDPNAQARTLLEGVDMDESEGVETQAEVLDPYRIIQEQQTDETLKTWRKVAELKNQVTELRNNVPEGQVTTPELSEKEGAYNTAFKALRDKAVQGKVSHMFIDEQGVLVIAGSNRQNPIPVVTAETGAKMIELGHDSLVGMHTGSRKLGVWLIQRCWWPSIAKDMKEHIRYCVWCQKMKFSASPGYGFQQMRWWDAPGRSVCIDLVVLDAQSTTSARYIFTILDCFSHFPDAYPIYGEATDAVCADQMMKWCQYNGVPQDVRSDGGANLNPSKIFKELYKLMKIKGITSMAYAPQSNAVERFHRWLGAALRIMLFKYNADPGIALPHILWIWRSTECRVTGFTPFLLHMGRECRFPTDLFEKNVVGTTHTEYVSHLNELTTSLYQEARSAQRIAQMEAAYYYNLKHGVTKDIKTGDLVLKKNLPTSPTDIPTHLLPRCSGPYEVLEISSMGVRLKHTTTGKEVKSSLRHIRPIYMREDSMAIEDGGPVFATDEYVIVKMMPRRAGTDPRWHLAKLLHPNLDEDAWTVQWCNTTDVTSNLRINKRFLLAWRTQANPEGETLSMNASEGWQPWTHTCTVKRFLTPSFKLLKRGKLPDQIKAIVRSKFVKQYW